MIVTYENGGTQAVKDVFLNGQLMKLVVSADDEEGTVTYYPREGGRLIEESPGVVKMGTLRGDVLIVLNEGWRYNTVTKTFAFIPENRR